MSPVRVLVADDHVRLWFLILAYNLDNFLGRLAHLKLQHVQIQLEIA